MLVGHKAGGDQQPATGTRTYLINDIVSAMKNRKLWNDDRLTLTIVARGLVPPKGAAQVKFPEVKARFGRVSLSRS